MRARLLCKSCEHRFNKNGERYVLSLLEPQGIVDGSFPLLDRLRDATASGTPAFSVYSGASIGIDTEQFAYFALSILWRAAVHRWQLPDGSLREQIDLAGYEEPIRKYLLSEAHFPDHVAIILTVCADSESRGTFYPPTLRHERPFHAYGFLTQGVHFDISIGQKVPAEVRRCCCISSPQRWMFLRDCHDRTFRAFAALASTSQPAPNVRH
jgi:hypothetical protein